LADGGRAVGGEDTHGSEPVVDRVVEPMVEEALVADGPQGEGNRRAPDGIQNAPVGQNQVESFSGWHGGYCQ